MPRQAAWAANSRSTSGLTSTKKIILNSDLVRLGRPGRLFEQAGGIGGDVHAAAGSLGGQLTLNVGLDFDQKSHSEFSIGHSCAPKRAWDEAAAPDRISCSERNTSPWYPAGSRRSFTGCRSHRARRNAHHQTSEWARTKASARTQCGRS